MDPYQKFRDFVEGGRPWAERTAPVERVSAPDATITEGEADPYDRTKAYNQDYRLATIPYKGARIHGDASYTGTDTVSSDEEAPRGPRVRSLTSTAQPAGDVNKSEGAASVSSPGTFRAIYGSMRAPRASDRFERFVHGEDGDNGYAEAQIHPSTAHPDTQSD